MCKWHDKVFVYFMLTFLALCVFPVSSMSRECKLWKNLGIYGGTIYDLAIDPCDPNRVFAGSFMGDGVFLTEDGGNNWQPEETANENFGEDTFKNHAVYTVKIAPGNSNVVWVAHDFWIEKSINGGQTWIHISNSDMQFHCTNCNNIDDDLRICRSLVIDPVDPNIVYVGTSGPANTQTRGAIYKTLDGGSTWKKIGFNDSDEFDCTVLDMDIDPQKNNVIWAVTNSGGDEIGDNEETYGTLYRSGNGGDSWDQIFPRDRSSSASGFFKVVVKPNDSNTVFTGTGEGIIKHYFQDQKWESERPIADSLFVRDISFYPKDPNIVYATWKDPQSGDFLPKFAISNNGGSEWGEPFTIGLGPDQDESLTEFLTLAVHPSNKDIIFGGELNLGVYKSENHGQTWNPVNNGINAMIINDAAIDPNDSNHIIVGTHCGVYRKDQDGDWLHCTRQKTSLVAFHPQNTRIFYAGVEGRLGKTEDGGESWIYSSTIGDEKNYITSMAINPVNPDTIFISVAGYENYGGIYKSKGLFPDNGDWFGDPVLDSNQYNFNIVSIDPLNSNHIFAGGGGYYDANVVGALYESLEGGEYGTWELTSLTGVIVNDLLIDPNDSNRIYVGCGDSRGTKIPVYTTMDGGKEWELSCKGMHREFLPLYGYNIWGPSPTDIFVVGEEGTILHYDGTWSPKNSGTKKWLSGIWGSSPTDVFTVGEEGTILHYDGTWSSRNSGTKKWLSGIWGSSPTDVFAVGEGGTILHYDGVWSSKNSGTEKWLGGIWGISRNQEFDIFVVGDVGTILHYDGSSWSSIDSNTTEGLWSVWGTSTLDVFAVGTNGTILHYDGSAWSAMESNTTKGLWGIWGASSQDVFAVGSNGTILHYDGSTWSAINSGIEENLMSVWGISSTEVFATGDKGTILRYNGSTWATMNQGSRRKRSNYIRGSQLDTSMTLRLRSSDHSSHSSMHTRNFGQTTRSSVTDLEFNPENKNIVYASTMTDGIFISTNQGSNWSHFWPIPYYVYAIATGSFISCTSGGGQSFLCSNTSYIVSGSVVDDFSQAIQNARVRFACDLIEYNSNTNELGRYSFDILAGCYDLTVSFEGYMDSNMGVFICEDDLFISGNIISLQRPPIQPRIDNANDGDIIIIEPGIYYENINFKGQSITLRSDPNYPNEVATTIIDGKKEGSVVTFNNGEDANSVIIGVTIQNGNANKGGGIYCDSSSPLISNCIIKENFASESGGGIYCSLSSPLISNCVITENSAIQNGGGIYSYNSMPVIVNASFLNNQVGAQQNQICMDSNSTIFSNMQIIDCGRVESVCALKGNPIMGRWDAHYKFFGKPCGQNNMIFYDEYFLSIVCND